MTMIAVNDRQDNGLPGSAPSTGGWLPSAGGAGSSTGGMEDGVSAVGSGTGAERGGGVLRFSGVVNAVFGAASFAARAGVGGAGGEARDMTGSAALARERSSSVEPVRAGGTVETYLVTADQYSLFDNPSSSASRRATCWSTRSVAMRRMYQRAPERVPSESKKYSGRLRPAAISNANRATWSRSIEPGPIGSAMYRNPRLVSFGDEGGSQLPTDSRRSSRVR